MSNAEPSRQIKLFTLPQNHDCTYLPNKLANSVFLDPRTNPTNTEYKELTLLGFRRSGAHYYRPHCIGCKACQSCRVLCQEFVMNRRHRRIWSKNKDINVSLQPIAHHPEYYDLYQSYIKNRHQDGDMYPTSPEQFESFILDATPESFFIEHRLGKRLIAVSLTDDMMDSWSAIYTFYDPYLSKRSLGTWCALIQLDLTMSHDKSYLYLGYKIDGCRKMSYKNEFQPQEYFDGHNWLR